MRGFSLIFIFSLMVAVMAPQYVKYANVQKAAREALAADESDTNEDGLPEFNSPEELNISEETFNRWKPFFDGDKEAYDKEYNEPFYYSDLVISEDDWNTYTYGGFLDLDNDGEDELIMNMVDGGLYLDWSNDRISIFEEWEGTASALSYVWYDSAYWIVHSDVTHAGRQMRWFTKYNGADNVVDSFELNAEYWDNEDGYYDENSDFTYRGKKITMEEYERLISEIFANQ